LSTSLANHYAEALADVAFAQKEADQVRQELADFVALQRESAELRILLGSPAVSKDNKRSLVEALVARLGAGKTLRNFLFVVLDHRRMPLVPEIQLAFDAQLDRLRGITRAEVTSAASLSDEEKAELRKVLEQIAGGQVEADYQQDPELIAGAVVRIGSKIYDGSVRTQLERLRTTLASAELTTK
jgi:F-type H+-transporting ATPase subunit delta